MRGIPRQRLVSEREGQRRYVALQERKIAKMQRDVDQARVRIEVIDRMLAAATERVVLDQTELREEKA